MVTTIEDLSIVHITIHEYIPPLEILGFTTYHTSSFFEAVHQLASGNSFAVLADFREWTDEYIVDVMEFMAHLKQRYPDRYRIIVNVDESVKFFIHSMEEDNLIHLYTEKGIHVNDIYQQLNRLKAEYLLHFSKTTMVESYLAKKMKIQQMLEKEEIKAREEYFESLINTQFIELLMGLSEASDKMHMASLLIDFANGLKATIGIATSLYFSQGVYGTTLDRRYLETAFSALNQLEMIGNYFNQKILTMFVFYIRSLLHHAIGNDEESKETILAADQLKKWFQMNNKEIEVVDIFDTIGFFFQSLMLETDAKEKEEDFKYAMNTLLKIPIEQLVWLRGPFFEMGEDLAKSLKNTVVITSGMLTVFYKSNIEAENPELPILLGNFVMALMTLVNEFGDGEALERIYFKKGAIYVQPTEDLTFILFTISRDVRDKVALKEFATKSKEVFHKYELTDYNVLPNEVIDELDRLAIKYFGN